MPTNDHPDIMAFIRTKVIKGHEYRYLVESERIGGTVRQKFLKYLGRADGGK